MKCYKCGAVWNGFGKPRARQVCEGCGSYLHICLNCHHFDRKISNSCKLSTTTFIRSRDSLNYCEEFSMVNSQLMAVEARVERAKSNWDSLWKPKLRSV